MALHAAENQPLIVLTCLYDRGGPATYRGIEVKIGRVPFIIYTGQPLHDYLAAGIIVSGLGVPAMASETIQTFGDAVKFIQGAS